MEICMQETNRDQHLWKSDVVETGFVGPTRGSRAGKDLLR